MDQQGEGEPGGEHAQGPDQRRSPIPAHPHRGEPQQAGEHGQVADPSCLAAGGGDQAGPDQRQPGHDGKRCGQAGTSGVGGERAGAMSDGQGAKGEGERDRPGGQPRQARPRDQGRCHRAIVARLASSASVLATVQKWGRPRCARRRRLLA
jgi:hypothetical protein